jgi:hypothetical protein
MMETRGGSRWYYLKIEVENIMEKKEGWSGNSNEEEAELISLLQL